MDIKYHFGRASPCTRFSRSFAPYNICRDNDLAMANDWQFIKSRWNATREYPTSHRHWFWSILIDEGTSLDFIVVSFFFFFFVFPFFYRIPHSQACTCFSFDVQLISKSERIFWPVFKRMEYRYRKLSFIGKRFEIKMFAFLIVPWII